MPCMGPDINQQTVDEALTDVMTLLTQKYKIFDKTADEVLFGGSFGKQYRPVAVAKLREGIEAVFFQDSCENF